MCSQTIRTDPNRAALAAMMLVAVFIFAQTGRAHAIEIPFVDLPAPYESSGPLVSVPSVLVGGTVGAAVGVLFIPPMLVVSMLPGFGLFDALLGPPRVGWSIGVHTIGCVVGAPLWLAKKLVWDLPVALIVDD